MFFFNFSNRNCRIRHSVNFVQLGCGSLASTQITAVGRLNGHCGTNLGMGNNDMISIYIVTYFLVE
jgi:hypothetical protein